MSLKKISFLLCWRVSCRPITNWIRRFPRFTFVCWRVNGYMVLRGYMLNSVKKKNASHVAEYDNQRANLTRLIFESAAPFLNYLRILSWSERRHDSSIRHVTSMEILKWNGFHKVTSINQEEFLALRSKLPQLIVNLISIEHRILLSQTRNPWSNRFCGTSWKLALTCGTYVFILNFPTISYSVSFKWLTPSLCDEWLLMKI